jgi:peptidoglycan/xylan/chitin deacetylase (PgdA/CDA1 family)
MRRQDILLSMLYCIGFSDIRNFVLRLEKRPVTRFLVLHDVPKSASDAFEANLSFLKQGTNVVSLEDYIAGRLSSSRINVVITFDDGYRSWVTRVLPVLHKLGLPATFFVSSGFVDLPAADQKAFARSNLRLSPDKSAEAEGLSEQDLRELARAGFTIGGHTTTHADLGSIDDVDLLVREVVQDKRRLEQIVGQSIDYFAYPYGSFRNPNHLLPPILAAAGYKAAATTLPGFNASGSDPYLLKRELITAEMPALVFRARVYGNTDGVQFLRGGLLQLLHWRRPEALERAV